MDNVGLWKGRFTRLEFWVSHIALSILAVIAFFVFGPMVFGPIMARSLLGGSSGPFGELTIGLRFLFVLPAIAMILYSAVVSIRRLHDLDKSIWPWGAIFFGPAVLSLIVWMFQIGYVETDLRELLGEELPPEAALPAHWPKAVFLPNPVIEWTLQIAVLAMGLWWIVYLGFFKGSKGPNRFGPDSLS